MKDLDRKIQDILDNDISSDKERIDALLRLDADNTCEIGINSTKEEKKETKKNSLNIYKAIKKIDKVEGELLLKCVDR